MSDLITSSYIIDAIAKSLTASDATAPVYDENQKQQTVTPCYHIAVGRPTFSTSLSNTAAFKVPVFVRYEPPLNDPNKAAICRDKAQQMFQILGTVVSDTVPIRGLDMHYEILDEMLIFYVTYTVKGAAFVTAPQMQELEQEQHVKE